MKSADLATRKKILLARIEIERTELALATCSLKQSATDSLVFKLLTPFLFGRVDYEALSPLNKFLFDWKKKYPSVFTGLSFLMRFYNKKFLGRFAGWGTIGLFALQTVRQFKKTQASPKAAAHTTDKQPYTV